MDHNHLEGLLTCFQLDVTNLNPTALHLGHGHERHA